jgi:serpin B
MNLRRISSLAVTLGLLVAACSRADTDSAPAPASEHTDPAPAPTPAPAPEQTDPNDAGGLVASDEERITSPDVPAGDLRAVVADNTDFALSLYQKLRFTPGNLFYSPFSISAALAMTWAGARGETESQMAAALHFTLPQERLHPAFDALDLALASRGRGAMGSDGGAFRLTVANAIWGQVGYPFEVPFLDTLALNYGAGVHVVDFRKDPEGSRGVINDWVAERTEDRIEDLLPPGSIDASTRLVLTNAIYFNAAWESPFDEGDTKDATFTRRDGTEIQVPTMRGSPRARYGSGDGWAAVELPYDRHELAMVLVLPDAGTIDAFEASLTGDALAAILGSMTEHLVTLSLPRFEIESQLSLVEQLSGLGMPIAFGDAADFSGISGEGGLAIRDVVHEAWVSVDEAGTEAAAATGVVVGPTSVPMPAEIHFDHPYLFVIRDLATETILFVGRVEDPTG